MKSVLAAMQLPIVTARLTRAASVPPRSRPVGASMPSQAAASAGKASSQAGASDDGSGSTFVRTATTQMMMNATNAYAAAGSVEPGGRSKNFRRILGEFRPLLGGKNRA